MIHRTLGKTGFPVGVVGFGAWAIGGDWGPVDDTESMRALHAAADAGVNFFDTADVYGDGHSERLIRRFRTERDKRLYVATKIGRRAPRQEARYYSPANLRVWTDRSRENLGVETLDLVQLHCPPDEVFDMPEVFAVLDELVDEGAIAHYGVSVETVDQALRSLRHPGVATVQIVFNLFRHKPAERFFPAAAAAGVGVIARVPLASGLLTGKITGDTTFAETDHRYFNRHGESFDVGETFSGIPVETGLEAVAELRSLLPGDGTLAQKAIRWILMFEQVSAVIPGAKTARQARENAEATGLPPLADDVMTGAADVYARRIAPLVHHRW